MQGGPREPLGWDPWLWRTRVVVRSEGGSANGQLGRQSPERGPARLVLFLSCWNLRFWQGGPQRERGTGKVHVLQTRPGSRTPSSFAETPALEVLEKLNAIEIWLFSLSFFFLVLFT